MKYYVLTALVAICVPIEAAKPRSINIALDTVIEFEKTSDIDFLNKIQVFLTNVKDIIQDNSTQDKTTRPNKRYKFTDFLIDVINTLKQFNDKDLKEVVGIFDTEVRKRVPLDVFKENIRRFFSNKLGQIKSVRKIRNNLNKLLEMIQYKEKSKDKHFLKFINSLYKRDSEEKLAKFIRELKIFRRSSSRRRKRLHETIRKAVQSIIFEHFTSLSEDIKEEAKGRVKDYLGDDLPSNGVNKISSHVYEKLGNVTLDSELFPEEYEEVTSKKLNNKENITKKLATANKKGIFKRAKRFRNERAKTSNNKRPNFNYSKEKLTHVTLYPESLELEEKKISGFRTTDSVPLTKSGNMNNIDKYDTDVSYLPSLIQNSEKDVNLKDREIYNGGYDRNDHTFMKVRVFSQNPKKSIKNMYKLQNPAYIDIKSKKYLSTPKTSIEFFGNLYNAKNRRQYIGINENGKVTDAKKQMKSQFTKTVTDKVENITKRYKFVAGNKFIKNLDVKTTKFDNNDPAKERGYRRAKELNNLINKEDTKKMTLNDVSSKIFTLKRANEYYASNATLTSELTTNKVNPIIYNITTEKVHLKFTRNKAIDDLHEIKSRVTDIERNTTLKLTKVHTETSKEPIVNAMLRTSPNKDDELENLIPDIGISETKATNQSFPVTFDLEKYLKNSEIKDIKDIEKKNEIEKKMREDMDRLFTVPSANATTEAYTDIFEALDDAFNLTPIN